MPSIRVSYLARLLRRLWRFLATYVAVYVVAAVGFYLLEAGRVPLFDSFYWAMVTIATVGYGDVVPTNPMAKFFTIGVVAAEVFLSAYLVTVVISTVQEEAQARQLGTLGSRFSGHIVVLGFTSVGRAAVRELLAAGEQVAVVTEDPAEITFIRSLADENRLYVTSGPPADQEILRRTNIAAAHSVIVGTRDDAMNLVAALNVRAVGPNVRIVVSVSRPELKQTLKAAGVTYVASPGDMGGRLCADAAFRPEVANAVEELTSTAQGADIEEFLLTEKTPIAHQTLSEAERLVRAASECLVIGYARPDAGGEYVTVLNPPATFQFQPGDAIIVLGTIEHMRRLQHWIGVPQGR